MFYISAHDTKELIVAGMRELSAALHAAIILSASAGLDFDVISGKLGKVVYETEADTKVDDADPYYPVIVHTR
jgi:hypothetical protein